MTTPDFNAMVAAIEHARVVDFARYVNRRLKDEPDLRALRLGDGWNVLLGGYAAFAATPISDVRPDDDPFV